MTPEDFRAPMEKALGDYGIAPKTYKGKELIQAMWNKFRGYQAEPFARALESACKKNPDHFPTPNKVAACLDLIAPPAKKARAEPEEPPLTREEMQRTVDTLEATGHQWLADMARRRMGRLTKETT